MDQRVSLRDIKKVTSSALGKVTVVGVRGIVLLEGPPLSSFPPEVGSDSRISNPKRCTPDSQAASLSLSLSLSLAEATRMCVWCVCENTHAHPHRQALNRFFETVKERVTAAKRADKGASTKSKQRADRAGKTAPASTPHATSARTPSPPTSPTSSSPPSPRPSVAQMPLRKGGGEASEASEASEGGSEERRSAMEILDDDVEQVEIGFRV